ncbi:unnamed protein product [Leptosia nina]|uniref:Uncharacterized protein n=1 Tax=Leptosia nina TaxID=320188 RepID=A0AAV1IZ40_9NEOP
MIKENSIPLIRIYQAEEGTSRTSEGEDNDVSEVNADSSRGLSAATSREDEDDSSINASNASKSPGQRTMSSSNSGYMSVGYGIEDWNPAKRHFIFVDEHDSVSIPLGSTDTAPNHLQPPKWQQLEARSAQLKA